MSSLVRTSIIAAIISFLVVIGQIAYERSSVLGVFRKVSRTDISPENIVKIPDTIHCEDAHYYEAAGLIFTACEDSKTARFSWFPPLGIYNDPQAVAHGSIHVVDPKSMSSKRLEFEQFDAPFSTHGIDVIADPKKNDAVYIFAVNHLPNPDYDKTKDTDPTTPRARSQIEIFHHVLGSERVTHLRSVRHELITTPNDVLAVDPTTFYVTNDHYYRDGALRAVEETFPMAKWTSTVRVHVAELEKPSSAENGVEVSVATPLLHNNNGLGHGPEINATDSEVLITGATSGVLYRMLASTRHAHLEQLEAIRLYSITDNPAYFADPYKTSSQGDAGSDSDLSGYVVGGLARGAEFSFTFHDPKAAHPVIVWYVPDGPRERTAGVHADKKVLFQDDGSTISSLSASFIVANPPVQGTTRTGWLFVTGFMSESMVAVKLDLSAMRQLPNFK